MTWLDGKPNDWRRCPAQTGDGHYGPKSEIRMCHCVRNFAFLGMIGPDSETGSYQLSITKIDLGREAEERQEQTIQLSLQARSCTWTPFQDDPSKLIVQHFKEDGSTELIVYELSQDGDTSERARLKFEETCFDEGRPLPSGLGDCIAFLAGPHIFSREGDPSWQGDLHPGVHQRSVIWDWKRNVITARIPLSWHEDEVPDPPTRSSLIGPEQRNPCDIRSVQLLPKNRVIVGGQIVADGMPNPGDEVVQVHSFSADGSSSRICSHPVQDASMMIPQEFQAMGEFGLQAFSAKPTPALIAIGRGWISSQVQTLLRLSDIESATDGLETPFRVMCPFSGELEYVKDAMTPFWSRALVPGICGERVVSAIASNPTSKDVHIVVCDFSDRALVQAAADAPRQGVRRHIERGHAKMEDHPDVSDFITAFAGEGITESDAPTIQGPAARWGYPPPPLQHVQVRIQLPTDLPEDFVTRLVCMWEGGLLLFGEDYGIVLYLDE